MAPIDDVSNALLTPRTLLCDDHAWRFPADGTVRGGYARLRIWSTEEGPLLAMVSTHDLGMSATNMATEIHRLLQARFAGLDVVMLEHSPRGEPLDRSVDTLQYVYPGDHGEVDYNAISPYAEHDPVREAWMQRTGQHLIAAGGPWAVDTDTAKLLRSALM